MKENNLTIGEDVGDICNRDGCEGTLYDREIEGCCSCHSNPPCSYCTEPRLACDECDWNLRDQLYLQEMEYRKTEKYKKEQEYYAEEARKRNEATKAFYDFYSSKEIATEFNCRSNSHTHFSMELVGYFPPSMPDSELMEKIKGTFGGRFTSRNNTIGRFRYIAYTD